MFAPWRSQNPVRKTWVSGYWKIIQNHTNQVNNRSIIPSTDVTQLSLTLKMTTKLVVETSATFTRTIKFNLLLKWLLGSNLSQFISWVNKSQFAEASNVIKVPKCNKGPKWNNLWPYNSRKWIAWLWPLHFFGHCDFIKFTADSSTTIDIFVTFRAKMYYT